MKLTSVEELKERHLGKIGTPKRDKYEQELKIQLLDEMIALRISKLYFSSTTTSGSIFPFAHSRYTNERCNKKKEISP